MRSLRTYLPPTFGIRINAIAPLATETAMVPSSVVRGFRDHSFGLNTPEQVAEVALGLVSGSHKLGKTAAIELGQGKNGEQCNGLTIYVEGGRGWDIEEGLSSTRDQWFGAENNERMSRIGAWFASVSLYVCPGFAACK